MPATRINSKNQPRERPTYTDILWEQSQDTKIEVCETRKELNARMDKLERDLKTTRQELSTRMDKIEQRMDKLDTKIDATRRELNERMDKLDDKIDETRKELIYAIKNLHNNTQTPTNYEQIATISTAIIAIGVLYSILSK